MVTSASVLRPVMGGLQCSHPPVWGESDGKKGGANERGEGRTLQSLRGREKKYRMMYSTIGALRQGKEAFRLGIRRSCLRLGRIGPKEGLKSGGKA